MILDDLRFGVRSLWKARGFSTLAILVLAVGIGATSAIFNLVDGALIRPLPFADPDHLLMLWEHPPNYARNRVSPLNFQDWSEQNRSFTAMAAVSGYGRTLTNVSGIAERIPGQSVTTAFFDVLGIAPIAGRTFRPDDGIPQANVVIVSERFWRSHLDEASDAVGRVLRLDGQSFTVVGIMPASFQILYPADIWTPFPLRRTPEQRRQHYLQVIGRLRPGVTIDQARSDMALVAERIAIAAPDTNKNWTVTVEPLHDALVSGELRSTSLVLGGVVVFVLLMACANVANLLLARGIGRTREIAVRAALGATRAQIARLLLGESLVLAAVGGVAGLALSWVVLRAAPSLVPPGLLPEGIPLKFDVRVTLFAAALTCVTGILFGMAPAWHAARRPLGESLTSGGRTSTGGAGRLRSTLAVAEVAGAVLLLAGAGLFVRTLASMTAEDVGFRADSVLTMSIALPLSRYPEQPRALTFFRRLDAALTAMPGVRSVGYVDNLPLDGWNIGQPVEIVGDPFVDVADRKSAHYQITSPHYFETMGISVIKGRAFTDRDVETAPPVCIVNEEFVRRFLREREPLGAIVKVPNMAPGQAPTIAREVVGVIKQVAIGAGEKERAVEVYVPMEQNVWYSTSLALKTAGPPANFVAAVKKAVADIDKDQPVARVRTMDEVAAEATSRPRFRATLVGTFALMALALAAVGIFGVLTFSVRERMREFGVRVALGASAGDILRLVAGSGVKIAAAGALIGLAAAALLTRALASLLFGVTPLDPLTFMVAPAILGATALTATIVPAVRAIRVDPAVTLRDE
ncbi:MAG TPA: ABC transporter permease [Vicinamibacterales bacterium]|jgi:putative ABC transport system permease protein